MARQRPSGCVHRQSHPGDQPLMVTFLINNGMITLENDRKWLYNSASYLEKWWCTLSFVERKPCFHTSPFGHWPRKMSYSIKHAETNHHIFLFNWRGRFGILQRQWFNEPFDWDLQISDLIWQAGNFPWEISMCNGTVNSCKWMNLRHIRIAETTSETTSMAIFSPGKSFSASPLVHSRLPFLGMWKPVHNEVWVKYVRNKAWPHPVPMV